MHYASKELCEELYNLTGWVPDGVNEGVYQRGSNLVYGHRLLLNDGDIPAYDLGYLLRKLPPTIENKVHGYSWRLVVKPGPGQGWIADYSNELFVRLHLRNELREDRSLYSWQQPKYGDTPEDALCKLAIALAKQNLIPKEGKTE